MFKAIVIDPNTVVICYLVDTRTIFGGAAGLLWKEANITHRITTATFAQLAAMTASRWTQKPPVPLNTYCRSSNNFNSLEIDTWKPS